MDLATLIGLIGGFAVIAFAATVGGPARSSAGAWPTGLVARGGGVRPEGLGSMSTIHSLATFVGLLHAINKREAERSDDARTESCKRPTAWSSKMAAHLQPIWSRQLCSGASAGAERP